MGGKTDEVKGRIKEAAGALTGNDKLREEGKTDQAVGKAKQAVQKAADSKRSRAWGCRRGGRRRGSAWLRRRETRTSPCPSSAG